MKKDIIKLFFIAVIGLTVFSNTKMGQQKDLSDFALNNVEALAGEGSGLNCFWVDWTYLFCFPNGAGLGCPCFM